MNAARLLIVNADDFGLSPGVNEGIMHAHCHGIVRSTSLMVRAPAARDAVDLARPHPGLGLGLHIDMGEWQFVGGEWVALYQRAPLDDAAALRRELGEQLELFRQLVGREPAHLDSHQHVHRREPLRTIVDELGAALRVPVRHHSGHARYCGDFYGQDAEGGPFPERVAPGFLAELVRRLEPGVTELCCHPAARVDFAGTYGIERVAEQLALCDPGVLAAVVDGAVDLLSFPELHARGAAPVITIHTR
jgi:chitin disaccharide deacetylase